MHAKEKLPKRVPKRRPYSPWPTAGKSYGLLKLLLAGKRVSVADSLYLLNLATPNARRVDLRHMGWPVMSDTEPHPSLRYEVWTVYYLEQHFLIWYASELAAKGDDFDPRQYWYPAWELLSNS